MARMAVQDRNLVQVRRDRVVVQDPVVAIVPDAILAPAPTPTPAPKGVSAHLMAHSGSDMVTLGQLAALPTPEGTDTWRPVPHADIVTGIQDMVLAKGWSFYDAEDAGRFQLSATPTGSKMFGVTKVRIPGIDDDPEFGLAMGFRNSHDKSMAFRMAVGTSVFICDNMMVRGDIQIRREHTSRIDIRVEILRALELFPQVAQQTIKQFASLKDRELAADAGVALIARAVEYGALPIVSFMDARASFLGSFGVPVGDQVANGDGSASPINHGGTYWAAYQSITAQWKKRSMLQLPQYSQSLNKLFGLN